MKRTFTTIVWLAVASGVMAAACANTPDVLSAEIEDQERIVIRTRMPHPPTPEAPDVLPYTEVISRKTITVSSKTVAKSSKSERQLKALGRLLD